MNGTTNAGGSGKAGTVIVSGNTLNITIKK